MNRYILIRRLKGPAILLLIGTMALLHQADLVSWHLFLPLLFILIGVLMLAERAALATMDDPSQYPGAYPGGYQGSYPGTAWSAPGSVAQSATPASAPSAQPGAGIAPSDTHNFGNGVEGGKS